MSPELKKYMSIWLIALALMLLWASLYYIFPASLIYFESYFGWERSDIAGALTLAMLSSAFFSPLAGKVIDQGHGIKLMIGSALLGAIGVASVPFASSLTVFYFIWFVIGVAMSGCLYEPCFAIIVKYLKDESAKAITIVTLLGGLASSLSFPVVKLMSEGLGLQFAFYVLALSIPIIAIPCLVIGMKNITSVRPLIISHNDALQKEGEQEAPSFMKSNIFWLLTFSFSLFAFNQSAALTHLTPLMQERGLSTDQALFIMMLIGPMQIIGRVGLGYLQSKLDLIKVTEISFIINIIAVTLLVFSGAHYTAFILYILIQAPLFGCFYILKPAVTRELMGDKNFGKMNGVMAMPYLAAFATAPIAGAYIWQIANYEAMTIVMAVFSVLVLLALMYANRLHKQQG
ncbi:MFS transporter [Vibrio sp.]|nr:MFS transporter [Vibrio sp.]